MSQDARCRSRIDVPTCSSASSVNRRDAIGSNSVCSRSDDGPMQFFAAGLKG
jgi:hypothetical protein